MANPLDRSWYNTLIDDDGSGTTGTVWNKAAVDALLDTVDASLAGLVDKSPTGTGMGDAAFFQDADTVTAGPAVRVDATNGGILLSGPFPHVQLTDAGAPVDQRVARFANTAGAVRVIAMTDDGSSGVDNLILTRFGDLTIARYITVLGGAIVFPSTAIPSAHPEALDDYRERAFVPTLSADGGASGQTYAIQAGRAVKVGGLVICSGRLNVSGLGTVSGPLRIEGFPFVNAMGHDAAGLVSYYSGVTNAVYGVGFIVGAGLNYGSLYLSPAGGPTVQLQPTHITAGFDVIFSVMYQAT